VDQDSDMNDAMRMHETERKQNKGVIHTVATCPFAGERRVTLGMRVPRKEYARSRHQRLFEENVRKTEGKLVKKKILSSGVVFTLEEGISASHVCLEGQQPLIECANMTLIFLCSLLCLYTLYIFSFFMVDKGVPLCSYVFLNYDGEIRPT